MMKATVKFIGAIVVALVVMVGVVMVEEEVRTYGIGI